MLALIDADTPLFAAAITAEDSESWVATSRLDRTIENLLLSVGCTEYKLFVSGEGNFRKQIDPSYKANRTQPVPKWREVCKQHLINKWGAIEAHGCEADDYCGIHQTRDTIICGTDKDLLQIPGNHFQWEIIREGIIVRPSSFIHISEVEGIRNFYKQLLTGDTSDNIIGIKGIGPKKAAKLIDHLETEEEMFNTVVSLYTFSTEEEPNEEGEKRFYNNCNLLWIMRELGVTYTERNDV